MKNIVPPKSLLGPPWFKHDISTFCPWFNLSRFTRFWGDQTDHKFAVGGPRWILRAGSGHHMLKPRLLRPKHLDAAPKMSIVRRMSMIRKPTDRVRKVNKRYEEVEISEEEGSVKAKEVGEMGQKGMQRAQVDLERLKLEVKETSGVRRTRRFHCKKPSCGETFPKKAILKKHIVEVHTDQRPRNFHCKEPGCYKTFPKIVALKLHTVEVHTRGHPAFSGTMNALPANSGAQVKKTRRFHCKEIGCSETFPKKAAMWLHTDEVHKLVDSPECAASPGTNSTTPADSGALVKKTRRFHCKKMGCTETFPKKAAMWLHTEKVHTPVELQESETSPGTNSAGV